MVRIDGGGGGGDGGGGGSSDVSDPPDPGGGGDSAIDTGDIDVSDLLNRQRQSSQPSEPDEEPTSEAEDEPEPDLRDLGGDPAESGPAEDMDGPGANGDVMDEDPGTTDGPTVDDVQDVDPDSRDDTTARPDSGSQDGPTAADLSFPDESSEPDEPSDAEPEADTADTQTFESIEEFETHIEEETGREIEEGEEFTVEDGQVQFSGAFLADVSRERATEAGRDLTDPASGPFQFGVEGGEPALASGQLEVGTGVFEQSEQTQTTRATDISGLELGDVVAEQRAETRADLESQLEAQTGTELGPEDIEFTESDGQISAELTEAGERTVAVERAPIVGAAEAVGVGEGAARSIAGGAFEFREFGREQRETVVDPALESLREAVGVADPIEEFEEFTGGLAEEEEHLLTTARQELAALGVGVADTASPVVGAAERAFPGLDDPLIRDPIEAGGEVVELGAEAVGPTVDAAGRAFPGLDDPLVRDPIEAAEEVLERGTEAAPSVSDAAGRAFPSVDDPLIQDPIEAGEAVFDRGADVAPTVADAAGRAFPGPDDPLVRDPIEAFGTFTDAGADALGELGEGADRAFPDADDPLVRAPIEAFGSAAAEGGETIEDLGPAAGRAFPGPDHPLVRDPIEAAEDVGAEIAEFLEDDEPGGGGGALAAGAVATGTRAVSLTPAGRVVVGGALAAGAAAETFESLPPTQQLAVGQVVAAASDPAGTARRSVSAGVDVDPVTALAPTLGLTEQEQTGTERGEMVIDRDVIVDPESGEVTVPDVERGRLFFPPEEGALPPDQAPPELQIPIEDVARREKVSDAITFPRDQPLPIQEDPIFLPEVQTPTAPKSEFNTGRHTPPEVPVDTADPTEPFGGSEIPLDDDLEGTETAEDFVFPGPEVPTPGQPTQEFADQAPVLSAAAQETILRRPEPALPQDPADIARQTGPGGPAFIFRRDPRVAPTEPVLRTPTADIDLSLVRPELARVLREGPELTAEDIFDATLPGTEATGRLAPTTRPGLVGRTTPDQAPGLDESVSQTPRTTPGLTTDTVTTPRVTTGTGTPTVTTPGFGTPTATATGPGFGTPTTTATAEVPRSPGELPVPALLPETPGPDRRRRGFDEFEREFLEPVISPEEALSADDGLEPTGGELAGDDT